MPRAVAFFRAQVFSVARCGSLAVGRVTEGLQLFWTKEIRAFPEVLTDIRATFRHVRKLPDERSLPVGDKSPKANKKNTDQKQSKTNDAASKSLAQPTI